MFGGEVYYYRPLNSVENIVGKTSFFFAYSKCVTNAIAVLSNV